MIIQSSEVLVPIITFYTFRSSQCDIGYKNKPEDLHVRIDVEFVSKLVESKKNGEAENRNGEAERKRKKERK
jgi:hypothetical protein